MLDVLYYASPVFLLGLSFQILVVRTGSYKTSHKIVLLLLTRITSLLLTTFLWIYLNLPELSMELIFVPAIIAELSLYAFTLFLNQNINEKIEAD